MVHGIGEFRTAVFKPVSRKHGRQIRFILLSAVRQIRRAVLCGTDERDGFAVQFDIIAVIFRPVPRIEFVIRSGVHGFICRVFRNLL